MTGDIRLVLKENVRYYRGALQISQQELAERCGVSTTYIGEIEIGRKTPSLQTLVRLANALSVEPYRLLLSHEKRDDSDIDLFADEVRETIDRVVNEIKNRY